MKTIFITAVSLVLIPMLLTACNSSDDESSKDTQATSTLQTEPVTITIGNITDLSGVAAQAMSSINKALYDVVRYYNDENLIPGVKLAVIDYDNQYDPAKDLVGYERLTEKGADFFWTPVPPTVSSLRPVVDQDETVLFTPTGNMSVLMPPGYVFSLGIMPQSQSYTLLKWIAENDPDFPSDRPASIGGAAWNDAYSDVFLDSMEEYALAHPKDYDFVGGFLTEFKFSWSSEIDSLKDCDYVFLPTPPQTFIEEFRSKGYKAKFIGGDLHTSFLQFIDKDDLWDEFDGMLLVRAGRWWNESGEFMDMIYELLERYRPDEAYSLQRQGSGYLAAKQIYLMLDIVRQAVNEVGPEYYDSDILYRAAQSWEYEYEDISRFNNFKPDKRYSQNYYAMYEARAGETPAESNLFRIQEDWIPQVTSP